MKFLNIIFIFFAILFSGCSQNEISAENLKKIEIDISLLDEEGLRGSERNKVSISYEFCIPEKPEFREEVKKIDSTVVFMPGSRGRIGAKEGECLCVGNTHQKEFRKVLQSLASLSYIERIIECHFE